MNREQILAELRLIYAALHQLEAIIVLYPEVETFYIENAIGDLRELAAKLTKDAIRAGSGPNPNPPKPFRPDPDFSFNHDNILMET